MKEGVNTELPKEAKEFYDGLHVMVRLSRWVYEKGLEEGFTPNQSLELSKTYMAVMLSPGAKRD